MVLLIELIKMMMIVLMIMNTEELVVLEDYLKAINTNQQKLMMVLLVEEIIALNIRVEEIDTKIYHQKSISILLGHFQET